MVHALTLTGTSSGSSDSPQVSKLKLARGLIYKIEVDFPPGPSGLLHCYMEYEGVQVYPTPAGENFYGDNHVIAFEDTRWVNTEPYAFDVYYWNEDTAYDHTFQIRIGLVGNPDLISRYVPVDFLTTIREAMVLQEKATAKQSRSTLQRIFDLLRKED